MRTLKIANNLFINCLDVDTKTNSNKSIVEDATDQFLIFDRSGSMRYYLNNVVDAATEYCKSLPEGSTVSVGYFSGTGMYNLSVPYTLKKELNGVITTIDTYRKSLGMTNFIEILNKLNNTVKGKKASLYFFTDGCHNEGGTKKDLEKALRTWADSSNISVFVGYGYIDRDTMSWMAEITNGSFVHLNNFADFKTTLYDFGTAVADSSPTISVPFNVAEKVIPISMSGKTIIEYVVDNGVVNFKPSKKGYKGLFFTSTSPQGALVTSHDLTASENTTFWNAIRALASVHSQKNNVETSLALLDFVGDKYLVRNLYESITPEEFSKAETFIRKSVFSTKDRFVEGEVHGYLPDPNAFCVLDALNILVDDLNAKLHIRDKDFEYTKIGKEAVQTDGPKYQYESDPVVSFNKIVMHKERLNISLSTNIKATVPLIPSNFAAFKFTENERNNLNLPENYPVTLFRTYSVIADGKVQTKKLVLSGLAASTVKKLSSIVTKRKDGKYIVDFTNIPLVNKKYVALTSGGKLADLVWKEKVFSDEFSVLNAVKKSTEEELGIRLVKDDQKLSEEAILFLENCYIKNGVYNPPVELSSSQDQYEAYTFSIDFDGYSKATASDVIKKIIAGKKATVRESILEEVYTDFIKNDAVNVTGKSLLEHIQTRLDFVTQSLVDLRKQIQSYKFGIILGNKGKMDEFSSRENMLLPIKVKSFNQNPLTVTAKFSINKVVVKI